MAMTPARARSSHCRSSPYLSLSVSHASFKVEISAALRFVTVPLPSPVSVMKEGLPEQLSLLEGFRSDLRRHESRIFKFIPSEASLTSPTSSASEQAMH
eukprot:873474-Rhodomonas_salina.2